MYKIIGANGREYGPVTTDQLRQWIAEGRANADTKVQAEGGAEWKALSSFPEFTYALAAGGGPSAAIPATGPVDPESIAREILARGYTVDIAGCISRGWELLKRNFWLTVATTLVVYLVLGGVGALISGFVDGFFVRYTSHAKWFSIGLSSTWHLLAGGVMIGGLYWFFLRLVRGEKAEFGDAFAGFSIAFGQLTAAYVVSTLLTYVGLIFCILPGIYLAVAWVFTLPLVIDKRLGFWEAMELSRKVVTKNWWSVFALVLLLWLIGAAGVIVCCVGVFVTAPISLGALMYAYEDIFGIQARPSP